MSTLTQSEMTAADGGAIPAFVVLAIVLAGAVVVGAGLLIGAVS